MTDSRIVWFIADSDNEVFLQRWQSRDASLHIVATNKAVYLSSLSAEKDLNLWNIMQIVVSFLNDVNLMIFFFLATS